MSRALLFALSVAALALAGCKGDADVTIVNNTSYYTEGDLDGEDSWGLNPNGTTTRQVTVGSFWLWSSSSEVEIHVEYHETSSSSSPITSRKTFTNEFEAGKSYHWETYVNAFGAPSLRLVDTSGSPGGLAP